MSSVARSITKERLATIERDAVRYGRSDEDLAHLEERVKMRASPQWEEHQDMTFEELRRYLPRSEERLSRAE